MTTVTEQGMRPSLTRQMLNKVPEVTLYFWLIKVLCTTVGETAADNLNTKLNLGLSGTTYVMGTLLIATLIFQFRARRYVPGIYWLAVVLVSIVGTLITDNLTDHYGVALETTTAIFAVILAVVFAVWYASEKTLSIHTIYTTKREAFYWSAILFTFALGTAAGDLAAERLSLGYWKAALAFGAAIAAVYVAHRFFKMGAILAFWIAYILTRPLGASIGDELSQSRQDGGLGLGTTPTSAIFLVAILLLVVYLTVSRRDLRAEQLGRGVALGTAAAAARQRGVEAPVGLHHVGAGARCDHVGEAVGSAPDAGPWEHRPVVRPAHAHLGEAGTGRREGEALGAQVDGLVRSRESPSVAEPEQLPVRAVPHGDQVAGAGCDQPRLRSTPTLLRRIG
jgi:uncharacterized membrane-anchored protein